MRLTAGAGDARRLAEAAAAAGEPVRLYACGGDRAVFSGPEELVVVVDGEVLRGKRFTVALSDKKVNFFYPPGISWRKSSQTANNFVGAVSEK